MDSAVPAAEMQPFWTDEKHVHFLNTMETSFVRAMLENQGTSTFTHHSLRLDRHLPDTSDSTLDLKPRTRKLHAPADLMGQTTRTSRKRSSQPYNLSEDQVVPHVENKKEGAACNGDEREGGSSNGDDHDKRA